VTKNTPQLLANTQDRRPCICKTTHSMAGKGIFIIRNDQDELEFETFIAETGNPTYVVTEFVDIERNVACHFFIHPNRDGITWFGSNENRRMDDGSWSPDSTIIKQEQEHLRDIQLPFVKDVVSYFQSLGFWGFCGVDVLFDKSGKGYLVDVNPRVTGSLPAIMVGHLLYNKYGYEYCLFRRSARYAYKGTAESFMQKVNDYNVANAGNSIIVVNSFAQESETRTLVQFGVYCNSGLEECQIVLDQFAPINKAWKGED
jgi:ATP-grasp domain